MSKCFETVLYYTVRKENINEQEVGNHQDYWTGLQIKKSQQFQLKFELLTNPAILMNNTKRPEVTSFRMISSSTSILGTCSAYSNLKYTLINVATILSGN
jgi:hypothetical protein